MPADAIKRRGADWISASDPTLTDDRAHGRSVADRWVNTSTSATFTCTDATNGAANWVEEDDSGGGGGGPPTGSAGGDLSGTYPNPVIAAGAVDFSKMQTIPTDSLIGRDTAGTGAPESITLNTTLEMDGSAHLRRAALTGDVTSPAGSNATTIAANAVTDAKLRDSAAVSVIGRSANSSGDPADIAAGSNDTFLGRVANALGFFTILQMIAAALTHKGALITSTGSAVVEKQVSGNDGAFLMENSGQSDGLEWVNAPSLAYGDGGDGSATIAAGTTTLTVSKDYQDLTVNGTLKAAGSVVVVRGTLTFGASGIIQNNGSDSGGSGAGAAGAPGNQLGGGSSGANGFSGVGTGANSSQTNSWLGLRGGGGKGGNGGQGNGAGSHPGGTGGTPSAPAVQGRTAVDLFTFITGQTAGNGGLTALTGGCGGASGGGDAAGAFTGSGGGGGGVVLVRARKVDATAGGTIQATGGNGGNANIGGAATAAGGGGGGGGGKVVFIYGWAVSGTLPTLTVSPGGGGNGAGTGSAGSAGTAGHAESFRMAA